ncbi:MAG TPA: CRISPR-associated protein Cas4 [Anaerolineales bacterium]|nr:CRISPR-associated protein Cas4 [Anaerolineales bacterium]
MSGVLIPLAIVLLLIAGILFWQAGRRQKAAGLPGGRVITSDTRQWGPVTEPLYDPHHGLTGKPDYLVQQGNLLIPIEVKSSRVSAAPYDAHIFQLAAYCMLVESVYGKRPPHGILHYPNRTFAIDYTSELESALLDILEEMRTRDRQKDVLRSHEDPGRCRGCGYRQSCDQMIE